MGLSWSAMRKILEQDNICDSLKGRIQYFATRYRRSHDEEGRVAVRLDGNEIFKSSFFDWQNKRIVVREHIVIPNMDKMQWWEYWDAVHLETKNFAGFDQNGFYEAFYIYQNSSIDKCLQSPDPVVRLFAIMDKRVGKRRLNSILSEIDKQPEWLQVFYRLRLEADEIIKSVEQQKRAN